MEEDFFILNGEYSFDNNIYVQQLPPLIIPERRVEEIEVLERDGCLNIDEGTYKPFTKTCVVYYNGKYLDKIANFLQDGDVIFSNSLDRYYKCKVYTQIEGTYLFADGEDKWYSLEIYFRCQPFGYSLQNEEITLTTPGIIFNPCSFYSKPKITIYGSGESILFYVNGNEIQIKNIDKHITIDSTLRETKKGTTPANDKKIGDYPKLEVGDNTISWDGTVTKVIIQPNWRHKI